MSPVLHGRLTSNARVSYKNMLCIDRCGCGAPSTRTTGTPRVYSFHGPNSLDMDFVGGSDKAVKNNSFEVVIGVLKRSERFK